MDLPVVTINLQTFRKNIRKIKKECKNINFIFPVKCCTNEKVLKIAYEKMDGFDVSNNNEYNIIEKYHKNRIICSSGPMAYELKNQKDVYVAFNNIEDFHKEKGIRINFNDNKNFEISHFGTSISQCNKEIKENIKYIHFHNSDEKNEDKCNNIYEQIKNMLKEFKNIKCINIGGHLEDLNWEEGIKYLNKVRDIVPENIKLISEVGDFLFKNCGTLYCKAIDCKIINNKQIIILNFSKMANQRWVHPTLNAQYKGEYVTEFYGNSCCEVDIYMENCMCKQIKREEELIFDNISPYGYQWNNSFNGINKMKYKFI